MTKLSENLGEVNLFDRLHIESIIREWCDQKPVNVDGLVRVLRSRMARADTLSERNPVVKLRAAIKVAGTQKAWADANGVSPAYVHDVLTGRREPGKAILTALKLRRTIIYERS